MMWENLQQLLQVVGPALAVYVGIRVDMASMKVRLDHLERDLYPTQAGPERRRRQS